MQNFLKKVRMTLTSLSLGPAIQVPIVIVLHTLACVQTVSILVPPESILHMLLFWSDPSNYLAPLPMLILGLSITILFLLLVLLRFKWTSATSSTRDTSTQISYLDSITKKIGFLCLTVLPIPLMRTVVITFQNYPSSSPPSVIAGFALAFYLGFTFPVASYIFTGTSPLSSLEEQRLTTLNAEFLLQCFRLIFAFSSFNLISSILFATLYMLLFAFLVFRYPVFVYRSEPFKKALTSAVAYACFYHIQINIFALPGAQDAIFRDLLGFFTFPVVVDVLTRYRAESVLFAEKPYPYQFKLFLFMINHIEKYIGVLQHFVLTHHRSCAAVDCHCHQLIEHLNDKQSDLLAQKHWYAFWSSLVHKAYDLKEIVKLPKSQLKQQTEELSELIFELAEVQRQKKKQATLAYIHVLDFRGHLETHGLLSFWDQRKQIKDYEQSEQILVAFCKTQKGFNIHADHFRELQMEFYQYMTLMQRTTEQTQHFWEEVLHPEPDEAVLRNELPQLADRNRRIREKYDFLVALFSQSTPLLEAVTNDYFELVLNISPGEPFHPIKKSKEEALPIKNRKSKRSETEKTQITEKLSLNNRCFSADSETPMLLVSVEPLTFGNIVKTNVFFQKEKQRVFGCVEKINDMIIPEMHASHFQKCLQLFAQVKVFTNHDKVIAIGKDKNLLTVSILNQAVPSMANGMLHGVFITKIQNKRGLFALDQHLRLQYKSEAFQLLLDNQINEKQLFSALLKNKQFLSADNFKQVCFEVCGSQCTIETLSCLSTEKDSLVFCELKSTSKATQSYENRSSTHKITSNLTDLRTARNKKSSFQTSTSSCVKMKEQSGSEITAEVALQRQARLNKQIQQTFQRILDHKRFGVRILNILCFLFTPLLLISLVFSITLIPSKIHNQDVYSQVYDANQRYHQMMKFFIDTAADLQRVMTNQQSFRFYEDFIKKANNYRDIDQIISYMVAEGIEESVPTFTLESNGSFSTKNMMFNQAVADKIKIPLANLLTAKHSDFNFSFWRQQGTVPSSPVQDYYWNFMANAVYSVIPNFFKLSSTKFLPLLLDIIKVSMQFILLSISVFCSTFFTSAFFAYNQHKLLRLKNQTYQLFEAIDKEKHEKRLQLCRQFSKKYLFITKSKYSTIVKSNQQNSSQQESHRDLQIVAPEQKIDITEKTEDKITQRKTVEQKKKKKWKLNYERASHIKAFVKYMSLLMPILGFTCFLIYQEFAEKASMNQNVKILFGQNRALELVLQSNLYSLNLGSSDQTLEKTLSTSAYLQQIIKMDFERIYLLMSLMDFSQAQTSLSVFQRLMYADFCKHDKEGLLKASPNFLFPGRFDYQACVKISNQIITKGYLSMNLYLMQQATWLINHHLQYASYNMTERMAFYEEPYFGQAFDILNYVTLGFNQASLTRYTVYFQTISDYRKTVIIIASILAVMYTYYLFFIKSVLGFFFNSDITDIRAMIMLTSYRTTISTPVLRSKLLNQMQNYEYF